MSVSCMRGQTSIRVEGTLAVRACPRMSGVQWRSDPGPGGALAPGRRFWGRQIDSQLGCAYYNLSCSVFVIRYVVKSEFMINFSMYFT